MDQQPPRPPGQSANLERLAETAERWLSPLALLGLRLGIGLVFWHSASSRIDGFGLNDNAVSLFADLYRLPLLPPVVAAWAGTLAEGTGAWLLFLGLGTRLGALVLLGVTLTIQLVVPWTGDGIDFNLGEFTLWGGGLLLLVIKGGGPLAVDRLLWPLVRRRLPHNF